MAVYVCHHVQAKPYYLQVPDSTYAHSTSLCQWRPLIPPALRLTRAADIVGDPGKVSVLLLLKAPPGNLCSGTLDQIWL